MTDNQDNPTPPLGEDYFHHGVIVKLFPSNNMGVVRTESGREVRFSYDLVILSGEAKTPLDLGWGMISDGPRAAYELPRSRRILDRLTKPLRLR
jgi:hypothetical protein